MTLHDGGLRERGGTGKQVRSCLAAALHAAACLRPALHRRGPAPLQPMRMFAFFLRLLAGLSLALATQLAHAASARLARSFPADMCAGDRAGTSLGCNAGDVQITSISVHQGSATPTSCVGGSSVTLDLDVTVSFGQSTRYDVGIFLSQDGLDPQVPSRRTSATGTGSQSCKVAVLPSPLFPQLDAGPYTINGTRYTDTCGDGTSGQVGTFTIPGVTVKCQSIDSSGALNIPFVVSWDQSASPTGDVCLNETNPLPGTKSKCNAPALTQGNVAVATLPQITKTNPATTISPGDTTTYTITITNTTGVPLSNVVFKDPMAPNLTSTGVSCSAQNASCPTAADTTVALMQGSGIVIPSMLVGGTVTFVVDAVLTGNPHGTLTNQASVSIGAATTVASASGEIVYPTLVNTKTVTLTSDPVNGTSNPKAIPGSESLYTISVTNRGEGRVDSNSVVIADPVPANTTLYVGNLGGSPAGPAAFNDANSGLTFTFGSLAAKSDDVEFSIDGNDWGYVPTPDASGYDALVRYVRFSPKGRMNGWSGTGPYPGFNISFRVKVN